MRPRDGRRALMPTLLLLLLGAASILARGVAGPAATVQAQAAPPAATVSDELRDALMKEGQLVYGRDCAECHAEGGIGAALGGNAALADKDRVITRILLGSTDGAMSAFGPSLTDREIASVGTFIRNTWDNAFGAIVEADVKRLRELLKKKMSLRQRAPAIMRKHDALPRARVPRLRLAQDARARQASVPATRGESLAPQGVQRIDA